MSAELGISPDVDNYRRVLQDALGVPFTYGNLIKPLRNGVEIFPAMLEEIDKAQKSIEFLTFVYWTGDVAVKFAEALARASRRGAQVRVLLDAFGAAKMRPELIENMTDAKVEVRWFRKKASWNLKKIKHRTHRKILVCDAATGFTGGVGIAAEWEGNGKKPDEWRDTHFRIEGPAVHGLRAAFIGNWIETGARLEPLLEEAADLDQKGTVPMMVLRSSSTIGWSDVTTLLRLMITQARHELTITTAYFVPDDVTLELLCQAAQRGVDVKILLPGPHTDYRVAQIASEDTYEPLLKAGVKIWNYQPSMLHAKVTTVDGVMTAIGSANFNQRSMRQDEEVVVVIIDPPTVELLNRHFQEDLELSEKLVLRRWKKRGLIQRMKEAATDPLESEM